MHSRSPLALYRDNIAFVEQLVRNDVSCASSPRFGCLDSLLTSCSATKIRLFLRKGLSVLYLLPTAVAHYIEQVGLYRYSDASRRGSASHVSSLSGFEDGGTHSRAGTPRSDTPIQ